MKKTITLLVLILITTLTACGDEPTKVPLIIYDYEDLYMNTFEQLIYDNQTIDTYQFDSYNSLNSQIIQNDIVNDLLEDKTKLIVVNPVDRLGVYPMIEKAKQNDTSIIFINREPLKEDLELYDKLYYIGAKPEQSAIIQAEIVSEVFGGNPDSLNYLDKNDDNIIQLVILKGEPGHQDAEIRTEVVVEELERLGFELEILSIEEAYFSQEIASQLITEIVANDEFTFELVIANNDAMAIGAINALKDTDYFVDYNDDGYVDHNTEIWTPIVGIDGLPVALDLIESGYLYGTVLNDSESMAKALNELTDIIINGKDINALSFDVEDDVYIWIDYQKITE